MQASLIPLLLLQLTASETPPETAPLPVVEVRADRDAVTRDSTSALSRLETEAIERTRPTHPNELLSRVPGAWISRGSGQEHLTAVRSPVLTGAGACGAFLVLEDQVPIRPAGFCNVNELFEVNIIQAADVEVVRGPGTVVFGSNALHGVIDVRSPDPVAGTRLVSLETGTDDYYRGALSVSGTDVALHANYTDAGSFRDDEGFRHGLANAVWTTRAGDAEVRTRLAWASLDQDTAGFILGFESYKDPLLRRQNLNPDAFREASAARLTSHWSWTGANGRSIELTPYARSSSMKFLQHFLPGTPLERNSQDSVGALFSWRRDDSLVAGADVEWARGELIEFQAEPITGGSAFLRETRPQGYHYDYQAEAMVAAAWLQYRYYPIDSITLIFGARAEYTRYEYDNRMLDGNTRDDGTPCGFGGCLYTRPGDRSDGFFNLAPEIGLAWQLGPDTRIRARAARGFRTPQATELYRLQSGQEVADLDTVSLDALELGWNQVFGALSLDLAAFTMRKDHFIFRDAEGFNVSDGRTRHRGIEAALAWQLGARLQLSANLSWARHEYDFDRIAALGETIRKGDDIDTAPRRLGAVRLHWQPGSLQNYELEWLYQGKYYLDAANAHTYGGHRLLNARAAWAPGSGPYRLALRVTNLLDAQYAERADHAFGQYRYFPGAERRFFLQFEYRG